MKKMTAAMCAMALGCGVLMSAASAHAQMSDDDKKFLATAQQGDINEIKLSQLAEQKATNPAVKAFAQKMVREHEALEKAMTPYVAQAGVTPAGDMDDSHKDDYKKLSGLSGKDFDKQYIDDMVSDHAKALDAFTKEAKDTKDKKLQMAVLKGKTAVAAHKNMAYDLKKKM